MVALAGGPGGSFSHPETAELLRAAGAEVVTVDPLRDEALPAGTRALVVGGALPEAYAEELSANRRLCIAVAELARTGRPVVAEGTGLLWLARELDGRPMCGVLDAVGVSRDGLVVGYREATAQHRQRGAPRAARWWSGTSSTGRCSPRAPVSGRRGAGTAARRRASSGAACTPRSSPCTGRVTRRRQPGWSPRRRASRRPRRCPRSLQWCPRDR